MNDLLMKFVPFLNVRWKRFYITSTTFLKTLMLLTTEEESNRELAFLDTLLKRNDGKISQCIYTIVLTTKQVVR